MDNQKYYYLKLKEDFFDREEIRIIEKMDNGHEYVNILLKLYLRSLKRGGLLMALDAVPYDISMISHVTGNGIDAVKTSIEIFQKFKLLEIMEDGAIYMTEIQNFIGSSSSEADRKRIYRDKIKEIAQDTGTERTNVQTDVGQKSTITKDITRDKDITIIKDIICDLNSICGTKYTSCEANSRLIRSRLKEGHTIESFKEVHRKMFKEWGGTDMAKYLRPATLYCASKFEGYLNRQEKDNSVSDITRDNIASAQDWLQKEGACG